MHIRFQQRNKELPRYYRSETKTSLGYAGMSNYFLFQFKNVGSRIDVFLPVGKIMESVHLELSPGIGGNISD